MIRIWSETNTAYFDTPDVGERGFDKSGIFYVESDYNKINVAYSNKECGYVNLVPFTDYQLIFREDGVTRAGNTVEEAIEYINGEVANGGQELEDLEQAVENLETNEIRVRYFQIVSAASGQITIPTGATIQLDQFNEARDALLTEVDSIQQKPVSETPVNASGELLTATLDSSGNYQVVLVSDYTTPSTPVSSSYAIVFYLTIPFVDFKNLDLNRIADFGINVDLQDVIDGSGTPDRIVKFTSTQEIADSILEEITEGVRSDVDKSFIAQANFLGRWVRFQDENGNPRYSLLRGNAGEWVLRNETTSSNLFSISGGTNPTGQLRLFFNKTSTGAQDGSFLFDGGGDILKALFVGGSANEVQFTTKGALGQTENLHNYQDNLGQVLSYFSSIGSLYLPSQGDVERLRVTGQTVLENANQNDVILGLKNQQLAAGKVFLWHGASEGIVGGASSQNTAPYTPDSANQLIAFYLRTGQSSVDIGIGVERTGDLSRDSGSFDSWVALGQHNNQDSTSRHITRIVRRITNASGSLQSGRNYFEVIEYNVDTATVTRFLSVNNLGETVVDTLAGNTDEIVTLGANGELQASGVTISSLPSSSVTTEELTTSSTITKDNAKLVVLRTNTAQTYTLWASPVDGDSVRIKNRAGGNNTIDGNGANIDGSTDYVIKNGESWLLIYDGTEWTIN